MRRWWSPQTAGFLAAGAVAGAAAWGLGPRTALALAMAAGVLGGLLVLSWLRARMRALNAELAQLRSAQQQLPRELPQALGRRVRELEERQRAELAAFEDRLLAAHGATEQQVRAEVSAAEQRLRSATSGDLVALEKRLRTVPPHPEVR